MITKVILSGLAVFAGWIAVLTGVMVLSDEAPAALVLFPSSAFIETLPAGVSITAETAISVTLSSEVPGFARSLYNAGAPLVLPAGLLGCAPLTS